MDAAVFLGLLLVVSVCVPLYLARREEPWRIIGAIAAGLLFAGVLTVTLSWADIDVGGLPLLLVPTVALAVVAALAIVLRLVQRRRRAPRAKSPYDFT